MRDFTEEINRSLHLLFQVEKQEAEGKGKKSLLDKRKVIYLQVALFKVPFFSGHLRKFLKLKHSLYGDDPEVCLFVPNRKTGLEYKVTTDELIDFCVDYYTELLEKHKVKGITAVMPLKQLQAEYGAYEMRRKLVHRFDLFLCKNSLLYNSRFVKSIGKAFKVANKYPLGIPFPSAEADFDPNFQKSLDRALFTSSFSINSFSDNYCIPVGCINNTKAELQENLQMVLNQILTEDVIPGGFKNIKAMYLWPSQSVPIPLYMSSEVPVGLEVKVRRKRERERMIGVEGEISTQPGKKVFVMPNGEVFVTKIDKKLEKNEVESDTEDEDEFQDDSEEEEEEEEEEEKEEDKEEDERSE